MKRLLIMTVILLLTISALVACGEQAETTVNPSTTKESVSSTSETTEPTYYFQTVDNFVELESKTMSSSKYFRHDEASYGKEGNPAVKVTAEIPSSVTLGNMTYELDLKSIRTNGRDVYLNITNVTPLMDATKPFVTVDAVTGRLTGVHWVPLYPLSDSEKEMSPVDLAKQMIAEFLPDIPFEGFELSGDTMSHPLYGNGNYDTATFFAVTFKTNIKGYSTTQKFIVEFFRGYVCTVATYQVYDYEDLDVSALDKIDKEETEKIIRSLIEYVRNGYKITEPELVEKSIVWMPDGRYAIKYDIRIQLDDPVRPYTDRILACVYLEDSKTE